MGEIAPGIFDQLVQSEWVYVVATRGMTLSVIPDDGTDEVWVSFFEKEESAVRRSTNYPPPAESGVSQWTIYRLPLIVALDNLKGLHARGLPVAGCIWYETQNRMRIEEIP